MKNTFSGKKKECLIFDIIIMHCKTFPRQSLFGLKKTHCSKEHENIITQGIPSLFLSVKFLSFFNDFY